MRDCNVFKTHKGPKKKNSFRLFIIATFFVFLILASVTSHGEQKSNFALTFKCMEFGQNMCLIGQIPTGRSVTLLSNKSSKICKARTTGSFKYYFDPSGHDIASTHIKLEFCEDPQQYFLAYIGNGQVNYQLLELNQFEDKSKMSDFNKVVRSKKLLKYEDSIPNPPKIFSFSLPRGNNLIAHYEATGHNGYGPLFLSTNGKIGLIHFLANIYRVFKLNGRLYLMYYWRGSWEGSGYQGSALIELIESGFILIFKDASWST